METRQWRPMELQLRRNWNETEMRDTLAERRIVVR